MTEHCPVCDMDVPADKRCGCVDWLEGWPYAIEAQLQLQDGSWLPVTLLVIQ